MLSTRRYFSYAFLVFTLKLIIYRQRAASVLTILGGTLLYTWVKSCEVQPPPLKDISRYYNTRDTRSTTELLEPGGDLSDEERSISDTSEIFSAGGHDSDDDEFGYALEQRVDRGSNRWCVPSAYPYERNALMFLRLDIIRVYSTNHQIDHVHVPQAYLALYHRYRTEFKVPGMLHLFCV